MEDIHGVDVSWLHRRDNGKLKTEHGKNYLRENPNAVRNKAESQVSTPSATPPPLPRQAPPPPVAAEQPSAKTHSKRPTLLSRNSEEKASRRPSWISSLHSKFSSQNTPNANANATHTNGARPEPASVLPSPPPTPPAALASPKSLATEQSEAVDGDSTASTPPQKSGSFFSSALRRLSSSNAGATPSKAVNAVKPCPRRVLNIDPLRERCELKELNASKLRKVAFSVDVEIAGRSRMSSPPAGEGDSSKSKDRKYQEHAEGNALKHPEAVKMAKEQEEADQTVTADPDNLAQNAVDKPVPPPDDDDEDGRAARKEKKRRKAEDSGSAPKEINGDDDVQALPPIPTAAPSDTPPHSSDHAKPTTDPLRVYRRCCQLREAPVLKRISEQLGNLPPGGLPGVVNTLDLRGSRLQYPDFVVLSDWLAIVPVQKLLLEDANLSDEALRVVLAGLLTAKMPVLRRHKRAKSSPTRRRKQETRPEHGVIEKLTLKNNAKLTGQAWPYIFLFIYMSKSLKALDLSLNRFPAQAKTSDADTQQFDHAELMCKALSERLAGAELEELIMAECNLSTYQVGKIVDGAIKSRLKRLGLAGNHLDTDGLKHAARFIQHGDCQGTDLGANDLRGKLGIIADALTGQEEFVALSLADCNLDTPSLGPLFCALTKMPNFRFIDLSHNHDLFGNLESTAVGLLRKYIPKFPMLRRLHLLDVSMNPSQAIALAEVLPEGRNLNHLNILENPALTALSVATDEAGQEDACALYASLMAAARVSTSILALDIDVPGPESSEVVKALAKQVVAYCLRNLELWTASQAIKHFDSAGHIETSGIKPGIVEVPEVLLHIVGRDEADTGTHTPVAPAPDNDYLVGGQGVVKALSYCLHGKEVDGRRVSIAPEALASPIDAEQTKAKDMSKNLLGSARKIRQRLDAAMKVESDAGDALALKRLVFLDNTLKGMIERFEEEYPETRAPEPKSAVVDRSCFPADLHDNDPFESGADRPEAVLQDADEADDGDDDEGKAPTHPPSRRASTVSLASQALNFEEARMHRIGQHITRDFLRPQRDDHAHGTKANDPAEPEHVAAFRHELERLGGEEMRQNILEAGYDGTLEFFSKETANMKHFQEQYPDEFKIFREAQVATHGKVGAPLNAEPLRKETAA